MSCAASILPKVCLTKGWLPSLLVPSCSYNITAVQEVRERNALLRTLFVTSWQLALYLLVLCGVTAVKEAHLQSSIPLFLSISLFVSRVFNVLRENFPQHLKVRPVVEKKRLVPAQQRQAGTRGPLCSILSKKINKWMKRETNTSPCHLPC